MCFTDRIHWWYFLAKQILVYFPIDDTLGVVPNSNIINDSGEIRVGLDCKVKDGARVYDARIIEIGIILFLIILFKNNNNCVH